MIVQVYCNMHSDNECEGDQRFCLVCKHQFCQYHFGIAASKSQCLNCTKRLLDIEDATIKAFNDLSLISSALPERLYPESLLKEIRKYQEFVRCELWQTQKNDIGKF